MSTVTEIEAAIEKLSDAQIEELAAWLQAARLRRATPPAVDHWLQRATGVAVPGATTDDIMTLTRGEG